MVIPSVSSFILIMTMILAWMNHYTSAISLVSKKKSSFRLFSKASEKWGLGAVPGNNFSFLSPKLVIGRGIALKSMTEAMKDLKLFRPFIITGRKGFSRYETLLNAGLSSYISLDSVPRFAINGEPTVEDAIACTEQVIAAKCDVIISLGGGSSIDLAKAVAALVTNRDGIYEYLEIIGKGKAIQNKPLPHICIPTTAGTGSECTKNAVLKSKKEGRKVSIRHDMMLPTVSIIDPMLTISCSPSITAYVGLDTLCQLIEPFTSNQPNPFTDSLAREGISRASRSLRTAFLKGDDVEAREDLAIASALGGLCLANSKLGAVHGFASVIGGMFDEAPHGAVCACLMPATFRMSVKRLTDAASAGDFDGKLKLDRFTEVATIITGSKEASAYDGIAWIENLVKDLNVPTLSKLCPGLNGSHVKEIVDGTIIASSTKGNPVKFSEAELNGIILEVI